MKFLSGKIGIQDFNIIFILCGFSFFTSIYSNSIASIIYRGITLCTALLCIYKYNGIFKTSQNNYFKIYIAFLVLYSASIIYQITFGSFSDKNQYFFLILLFLFGITWIPLLGYIISYDKIDKANTIKILFCFLLFIILKGYLGINDDSAINGRFELNSSQSTLAFGDKGMMLSIASASLLLCYKQHFKNKFFRFILIFGLIIGIMATLKAGSRGPLVAGLFALWYLGMCAPKGIKGLLIITFLVAIALGAYVITLLADFAPVIIYRLTATAETGDTSGRDEIFSEAFNSNAFFWGGEPFKDYGSQFMGYHNVYLTVFMGCGIIIGTCFCVYILFLLYKLWKRKKTFNNPFDYFFAGMFYFYFVRGITGVDMITTDAYNLIILAATTILGKRNFKFKFFRFKNFYQIRKNPKFIYTHIK